MTRSCPRRRVVLIAVGFMIIAGIIFVGIGASGVTHGHISQNTTNLCVNVTCTVCQCTVNSTCVMNSTSQPQCVAGPSVHDGVSCDDSDPSTMYDACYAGVCKGLPLTCNGSVCSDNELDLPPWGASYAYDECHDLIPVCKLQPGMTHCTRIPRPNGYDCGNSTDIQRCWAGLCVSWAAYNASRAQDACTNFPQCSDEPPTGLTGCWLNGTGSCVSSPSAHCVYAAAAVNTSCIANGTAGLCDAFGNCLLHPFVPPRCSPRPT